MIQIYKAENRNFASNGDMILTPTECYVEAELNGPWQLTLEHPIDDEGRWKTIEAGDVLSVPMFNGTQLYRIVSRKKEQWNVYAEAEPIFMDAKNDAFLLDVRPTGKNGQEALSIMCAQNSKYSGESNIKTANTAYYENKNLIEAINGDDENSFINRWGGEILYDNYKIIINERVGGDYGTEIRYGKNIIGISEEISREEVVTRIVPMAFNGYMLEGNTPWVDSPLINTYPHIFTRLIKFSDVKLAEDASEGETAFQNLQELRKELIRRCNLLYSNENLDKELVEMKVDIAVIQNADEYKEYKSLEQIGLGDTVHLRHSKLDITSTARAIMIKYNCIKKRTEYVTIGAFKSDYFKSMISMQNRVESAINKDGTVMAERIKGIINGIEAQLRVQSSVAKKVDGRAFLIEDLDNRSELYGAMEAGTQGLRIAQERSVDGRSWEWRTAITAAGIIADAIISGLLSDATGKNWWNLDTGELNLEGIFRMVGGSIDIRADSDTQNIIFFKSGQNTVELRGGSIQFSRALPNGQIRRTRLDIGTDSGGQGLTFTVDGVPSVQMTSSTVKASSIEATSRFTLQGRAVKIDGDGWLRAQ